MGCCATTLSIYRSIWNVFMFLYALLFVSLSCLCTKRSFRSFEHASHLAKGYRWTGMNFRFSWFNVTESNKKSKWLKKYYFRGFCLWCLKCLVLIMRFRCFRGRWTCFVLRMILGPITSSQEWCKSSQDTSTDAWRWWTLFICNYRQSQIFLPWGMLCYNTNNLS